MYLQRTFLTISMIPKYLVNSFSKTFLTFGLWTLGNSFIVPEINSEILIFTQKQFIRFCQGFGRTVFDFHIKKRVLEHMQFFNFLRVKISHVTLRLQGSFIRAESYAASRFVEYQFRIVYCQKLQQFLVKISQSELDYSVANVFIKHSLWEKFKNRVFKNAHFSSCQ